MSAMKIWPEEYTGKDKFIKFEGNYHGQWKIVFLIVPDPGSHYHWKSGFPGVTRGTAMEHLVSPYNDLEKRKLLVEANKDEIAAMILEPVARKHGLCFTGARISGEV